MTTRIVVIPTGPKATSEAIAAWVAAAQKVADEQGVEVELNSYAADGVTLVASIVATPAECGWDTRRGDGPLGGPCRMLAGHGGPHSPLPTPEPDGEAGS